jgi:chemotaxis protein methyltransferase CheR
MMSNIFHTNDQQIHNEPNQGLSNKDFQQLSELITTHCGIKMPVTKKAMLESRLQKRLRALKIKSFREYCNLLFNSTDGACELIHMIDAVTTNKTDFFRESLHFDFLMETVFPEYVGDGYDLPKRKFVVWSAGCSTGQEPYTLAITLSEFAARCPGFQFSILATDISTKVLEMAQLGIYDQKQMTTTVPDVLMKKYFMKSKDKTKETVRVVPELRALVQFKRLNLLDERLAFANEAVDAIFCRNVLIYFDQVTQHGILSRLCNCLKKGGHLFLGHSETVYGLDLPIARIASTIYKKIS